MYNHTVVYEHHIKKIKGTFTEFTRKMKKLLSMCVCVCENMNF